MSAICEYLQEKISRVADQDLEFCVEMLEASMKKIVRKYLNQNEDECWEERGKISEQLLFELKEEVSLELGEYQEMCEELQNARELKIELVEKICCLRTLLEIHGEIIEHLQDYRRPNFFEKVESIEYFVKEKQKFVDDIEKNKELLRSRKERLENMQQDLRVLKDIIKCHKFLVEVFNERPTRSRKDKAKTFAIKIISANDKYEKTNEPKQGLFLKSHHLDLLGEEFKTQNSRNLDSPASSNSSVENPIDHFYNVKDRNTSISYFANNKNIKADSPQFLNRQNIERLDAIKKKTEFCIETSPVHVKHSGFLSPPVRSSFYSLKNSDSMTSVLKIAGDVHNVPKNIYKASEEVRIENNQAKGNGRVLRKPNKKVVLEAWQNVRKVL